MLYLALWLAGWLAAYRSEWLMGAVARMLGFR
jgi:hypothetical protein